ncbi:MAG: hypothetical protein GIW98_04460 [Candidatus Eremiobacteraeota bacterium]|nr:hypothetical protein [Candidatus Eremiobacteraeota bacterium]
MFINAKSRVARGALGLIFATALTYPTPANAVPGGAWVESPAALAELRRRGRRPSRRVRVNRIERRDEWSSKRPAGYISNGNFGSPMGAFPNGSGRDGGSRLPSAMQLRLPSGDISNLHGDTAALGLTANVPVQIQPLNGQQVIVLANAQVAQLVDANACVTINASCIANNGGTAVAEIPL